MEALQAPGSIKIISSIGFLEACAIVVYSIIMIIAAGQAEMGVGRVVALAIFFLLIAATIAFSAFKLLKGKPSARSMLLVWQLFLVIISVQAFFSGQVFYGLVGTTLSGIAIILMFSTSTSQFLDANSPR